VRTRIPCLPNGRLKRGGGLPVFGNLKGTSTNTAAGAKYSFLEANLKSAGSRQGAGLAVERLGGQPEHEIATEIRSDIPLCDETLAARCTELPGLLETPRQPAEIDRMDAMIRTIQCEFFPLKL